MVAGREDANSLEGDAHQQATDTERTRPCMSIFFSTCMFGARSHEAT